MLEFRYFEQPWFLVLIPFLLVLVWLFWRQKTYVGYSSVNLLRGATVLPLSAVQKLLISLTIICAVIALSGPYHEVVQQTPVKRNGRDIVILFDRSGSMMEKMGDLVKLDTAKAAVSGFIEGCPEDRITLISFTDVPRLEWPPSFAEEDTGHHDHVLRRLDRLSSQGGTDIPRAMSYALEIVEFLQGDAIGKRAVVFVSDGISEVEEEERQGIVAAATELDVTIHWIFIESKQSDFVGGNTYSTERLESVRATIEATGGRVFETDVAGLEAALGEIDRLEAMPLAFKESAERIYHHRPFIIAALAFFAIAAVIELGKEL
jgi:hypothetical protein